MPYPMAAARGSKSPLVAVIPPSYWLVFDGSNDYIALPSSHGQEPSTAIFIEAWVKDFSQGAAWGVLLNRGDFFRQGYDVEINQAAAGKTGMVLALDNGAGSAVAIEKNNVLMDTLPVYLAFGWDGATIYYFAQGMLIAKTTEVGGALEYDGTMWTIGDMVQGGGPVWPMGAKLAALRVSNTCRHTASFAPPTTFTPDANTVGLWLCQEGAGTTLNDSGPSAHDGTFKGAGEPAWGAAADLMTLTHGEALWTACSAIVPAATGGAVWLNRVDANHYRLFKKIHATGPYWAMWSIGRTTPTWEVMGLAKCSTGIPDPANDTPSSWTTNPATELITETVNEYVFQGSIAGGVSEQWGSGHGYETLDSESWTVDGVPTVLEDGGWASGSEIKYNAALHHNDAGLDTLIVEITKTLTLNTTVMYLEGNYTFDWLVDWLLSDNVIPAMMSVDPAALPTVTFVPGGTDYPVDTTAEGFHAHAAAVWGALTDCVAVVWTKPISGLRYSATPGASIWGGLNKIYLKRTQELDGALADTSWTFKARWMVLDNCGNHFLKTT